MSVKSIILGTVLSVMTTAMAWAGDITITDSYARSASKVAKSGAAFLVIQNGTDTDDRLINASSPAAEMVQLHTHKENSDGVMQMLHVEEGFELPAGGKIMMERGGNHVMLMGLTKPFEQDEMIPLTLTFEHAGDMTIEVPVDLDREPGHAHGKKKAD